MTPPVVLSWCLFCHLLPLEKRIRRDYSSRLLQPRLAADLHGGLWAYVQLLNDDFEVLGDG